MAGPGIIPARAGFTLIARNNEDHVKDHPRSRGVYGCMLGARMRSCGSSPLARGLPNHAAGENADARIIPARAGFTIMRLAWKALIWDHPRSRGVY